MMNYDKAAIEAIFKNQATLTNVIEHVLIQLHGDLNEKATFSDAMDRFQNLFETMASESAATHSMQVDMAHYYARTNMPMTATTVQNMIDYIHFKDCDKYVNQFLAQMEVADYLSANNTYVFILKNIGMDYPGLSKSELNDYLINLNNAVGAVKNNNFLYILNNLQNIASKQAMRQRLMKNFPPKAALKRPKI